MKYSFDNTPRLGEKLNRLAREEMKLRLLRDIQTFLEPVFDAIVNEDEWQKQWLSIECNWKVVIENE